MSGVGMESLFPHWVRDQQLALAAWRLQNPHVGIGDGSPERPDLAVFTDFFEGTLEKFADADYERLPVLTLAIMQGVRRTHLRHFPRSDAFGVFETSVGRAFRALTLRGRSATRPPIVRSARILSDTLLGSSAHPRGIAALASAIMSRTWRACSTERSLRRALQDQLPTLRSLESTAKKLEALATIARAEAGARTRLQHWHHVQNYAVSSCFVWPLLTLPIRAERAIGFALPLALDVVFDGKRTVHIGPRKSQFAAFRDDFDHALGSAIDLWKSEHGNAPQALQNRILTASVRIDAGVAEAIMRPFGAKVFDLDGPSLQVYIAVAILGRLIGIPHLPPIAATGKIGFRVDRHDGPQEGAVVASSIGDEDKAAVKRWWQRRQGRRPGAYDIDRREKLDRYIEYPDGVEAKLRWAHASGQYDRMIVPTDPKNEGKQSEEVRNYISAGESQGEIVSCEYLSTAADAALSGAWRRHKYVRGPDVARAITQPLKFDLEDMGITKVRQQLALNIQKHQSVWEVPEGLGLRDVVLTLRLLNRLSVERGWPMRSLTFFRMQPYEKREQLLSSLWKVLGAPEEDLVEVVRSSDAKKVEGLLAAAFNTFGGDDVAGASISPDILIMILPKPEPDRRPAALEFEEPFDFRRLFNRALAERLKPVADKRWETDFIGRTRVIIVADTGLDVLMGHPRRDPDPGEAMALERLSVFRHGFTQTMAHRALVGLVPGQSIRSFLDELVDGRILLKVSNLYFLRDVDRDMYRRRLADPIDRAVAHRQAALACAPYLISKRLPGLVEFEARFPEMVHEAYFHLDEAILLMPAGMEADPDRWQQLMGGQGGRRHQLGRLRCSYEIKSWDVVRSAATDRAFPFVADALNMGIELMKEKEKEKAKLLPFEVVSLVRLIDRYVESTGATSEPGSVEEVPDLVDLAQKLAKAADKDVAEFTASKAPAKYAVFVASHVAAVAMRGGIDLYPRGKIVKWLRGDPVDGLNALAHRVVVNDAELAKIPPPEWFVRFADRPDAPTGEGLQTLYRIGRANNAAWIDASVPLWIHPLGASATPEEDEAIFAELENFRVKENRDFQRFHARTLAIKSTHQRWERGYPKYAEWYAKAGGGSPAPASGIIADLDDVLEEEEAGDGPSGPGGGERERV